MNITVSVRHSRGYDRHKGGDMRLEAGAMQQAPLEHS